jgi:hypothetical protein
MECHQSMLFREIIASFLGVVRTQTRCVEECAQKFKYTTGDRSQSQWLRGIRRGSAAARFLGSRIRIPPGHGCLSVVSVVFCQVEVSVSG